MNVFQLLGLTLMALLVALTLWVAVQGQMRRRVAALWLGVWLLATSAIAVPELTMTVAHALGIGRGADLVFYCAILAIMVVLFFLFARLRRLDESMTHLVRHLAIQEAASQEAASQEAASQEAASQEAMEPEGEDPAE